MSTDGGTRYFAFGAGGDTVLEAARTADGEVRKSVVSGSWGITNVTLHGDAGGLSADGKTLVFEGIGVGSPSTFLIVNAHTLKPIKRVVLSGSFEYDALSPDGSRLYLIQHTSVRDQTHYIVRSYDLRKDRLVDGRIADKTQQGWVMSGYPMTRATGPGGRWVYTLYQNPGGYPFIHALDTMRGIAHCTGLPWTGDQKNLFNIVLTVQESGNTLAVHWKSGRPWLEVNTADWRITHVAAVSAQSRGFAWSWALIGTAGVLGALGLALLVRRAPGRVAPSAS
jgi:hypothetical protein